MNDNAKTTMRDSIITLWFYIHLILLTSSCVKGDCIFGPTSECAYPCRCSDSASGSSGGQCDTRTGVCNTGVCLSVASSQSYIGQSWGGDGCQTGNIALGKIASISNGADQHASTNGFTGYRTPLTNCIAINNDNTGAWWMIDLGAKHRIFNVTIYNTYENTEAGYLGNFNILQGKDINNIGSLSGCSSISSPIPIGDHMTRSCPVDARYIGLQKVAGDKTKMTICEVAIMGYKLHSINCSNCKTGKCHEDMWCEECVNGWSGFDCKTVLSCPTGCNCDSNYVCQECKMWYFPNNSCIKHISTVNIDSGNMPVLSNPTQNSLTVTFKQANSITPSVQQYYLYEIKYKKSGDGVYTSKMNYTHSTGVTERSFQITGLQSNTNYEVILKVYRLYPQKLWFDVISTQGPANKRTACPDPVIPTGVSAVATNTGLKISWELLGYPSGTAFQVWVKLCTLLGYPSCNIPSKIEFFIDQMSYPFDGSLPEFDQPSSQTFSHLTTSEQHVVVIKVAYMNGGLERQSKQIIVTTTTTTTTTTISTTSASKSTSTASTTSVSKITTTTKSVNETAGSNTGKKTDLPPNKDDHSGLIAGIVVAVIVVIVLIVVAIVIYLKRFRNYNEGGEFRSKKPLIYVPHRFEDGETSSFHNNAFDKTDEEALKPATVKPLVPPASVSSTSEGKPIAQVSPIKKLKEHQEQLDEVYGNMNQPLTRVTVGEFESYIERNTPTQASPTGANMAFSKEYKLLPLGEKAKAESSLITSNTIKNRFTNVVAYDHTRVVLDIVNDDEDSDYINANYLTGYKDRERAYVATQGPKKESIEDFWRMIWIVNTNRIVMITKVSENGKRKSEVYWPEVVGGVMKYSYITVTTISVETFADYTIRIFNVQKEGENETRMIRHLHFTSWTDKSIPEQKFPLLAFRRKVRALDDPSKGPIVVHCSAGIGRTGTFIALDYLLDEAADTQSVDVFEYVCLMRSQRMNMVQTMQQYQFIYYALMDSFKAGNTTIPCEKFENEYNKLKNNTLKLQQEFDRLSQLTYSNQVDPRYHAGFREENQSKNRFQDIIPADKSRPFLSRCEGFHNDYINAAFVVGFKKKYSCIATQMPLEDTVIDFWRLIWDHSSKTIVMLNQIDPDNTSEEVNGAIYWPDDDCPVQEYGPIQVELTSQDDSNSVVSVREFKVKNHLKEKEDPVTIQQFQVNNWPSEETLPSSAEDFVTLLETVEKWQQSAGNGPIIVHCMDGCRRSGLYCAASYLLDRLKEEQEVDPFLSTRFIRLNRPQFIPDLDQYTYLYEIAAAYMSGYEMYANFK